MSALASCKFLPSFSTAYPPPFPGQEMLSTNLLKYLWEASKNVSDSNSNACSQHVPIRLFTQKKKLYIYMPLGKALGSENTLQAFSFRKKKNLTQ